MSGTEAEGLAVSIPTTLVARHVRLVRVHDTHLEFLYRLLTHPVVGFRHALAGRVPSPSTFIDMLAHNVLEQFIVQFNTSQRPVGLVRALDASCEDGRATVSVAIEPRLIGSGVALEAAGLLADYLFIQAGLRKIYAEIPEFNLQYLSGAVEYLHTEATLRRHTYYAGRYWDVLVVAMDSGDWHLLRTQFLEDLVVDGPPPVRSASSRRPRKPARE